MRHGTPLQMYEPAIGLAAAVADGVPRATHAVRGTGA